MWQRFTERTRRVIFFAQEEAAQHNQNYVGTEHFLLALLRENDNMAARILLRLEVDLKRLRQDMERQIPRGDGRLAQEMMLTPRAKRVIDLAYEEARRLDDKHIGPEHLLLGLVREPDGMAAHVLQRHGVDAERVREALTTWTNAERAAGLEPPAEAPPAVVPEGTPQRFREGVDAYLHAALIRAREQGWEGTLRDALTDALKDMDGENPSA